MARQDDTDIHGDPTVVAHVPDLGPIRQRASSAPPKPQPKRAPTSEELRLLRHADTSKNGPTEAA